ARAGRDRFRRPPVVEDDAAVGRSPLRSAVAPFATEEGPVTAVPLRRILHAEDRPPTEVVLPDCGRTVAVPAVLRRETRWSGDLPANFRAVPGKPAVAFGGRPLYPEFVILRLLEDAGWSGVWVNNWG